MQTEIVNVRVGSGITSAPDQRVTLVNVGNVTIWWGSESGVDGNSGVPLRAGDTITIDTDSILYGSVAFEGSPPVPGRVAVSSVPR